MRPRRTSIFSSPVDITLNLLSTILAINSTTSSPPSSSSKFSTPFVRVNPWPVINTPPNNAIPANVAHRSRALRIPKTKTESTLRWTSWFSIVLINSTESRTPSMIFQSETIRNVAVMRLVPFLCRELLRGYAVAFVIGGSVKVRIRLRWPTRSQDCGTGKWHWM